MKGILYSIIAALLIIPIIGLIMFNSQLIEKNVDVNIRANELQYFSISVEDDMNRFLKIAGKRALISAVSEVVTNGVPLVDAQANLTEMIINGTLNGVEAPLIGTNNLISWENNVILIANDSGFDMTFQNIKVNVTQNDSYNVLFDVNGLLNISDPNIKMGIAKNLTVDVAIPIDGIEDPLFPLETYGRVIRIIQVYNFTNFTANLTQGSIASGSISGNATNYTVSPNNQKIFITDNMTQSVSTLNQFGGVVSQSTYIPVGFSQPYIVGATNALSLIKNNTRIYLDFQTKKVWDLQNFTTFVKNKYYKASADGPSFLDRLEGRLNLSTKYRYGLETFVDLNELASADLGVNYQYSCVDYLYWNNTLGSSIRNGGYDTDIPNVFSWLKIDQNHANIYGVNELI